MNAKNFTICLGLIIMGATLCSAKSWRGIVPLKSNRIDVERILGRSNDAFPTYQLANETVSVEYAPTEDDVWKVPSGTVISIIVIPKYTVRLTDLGIDLQKFKKERAAKDMVESFIYIDETDGFTIEVAQGIVNRFTYEPTKAQYRRYRIRTNR